MAKEFLANTYDVSQKAVLITGASSGFGEHFAKVFAKAGVKCMALLARREKLLEKLGSLLQSEHPELKVYTVACDVTSSQSIKNAFDKAEKQANRVFDVIINNAGIGLPRAVLKVDESHFQNHMNVNLKGSWFVAQEAAKRMIAANQEGSIINISSIYGLRVGNGHSVYSITKAGLTHMAKAMALELIPHKIRVNSVNPGFFLTPINEDYYNSPAGSKYLETLPSKRLGELDELNGVIILLASNASRFMYGSVITVDGAHVISSL